MTIDIIVANAQQQTKTVTLSKGQQIAVASGDTLQLISQVNIRTMRKGNDLVIQNAHGEEFVLKDFYIQSEKPDESQSLAWRDPLGEEKEIFSEEDTENVTVAANDTGVAADAASNAAATEPAHNATGENPDATAATDKKEDDDKSGFLILGLAGAAGGIALAHHVASGGGGNGGGDGGGGIIDTTPPSTTAAVTAVIDNVGTVTGTVSNGSVTDDTRLDLGGTLTQALAAGETVRVYDGATFLGNAIVSGTTWTFSDPRTLADGQTVNYTARVADSVGNQSPAGTPYSVTIDTTTPAANTIAITAIVDDSGVSLNDFITNDTTLVFSGSVLNVPQPDERVQISLDGGTSWINASTQPGAGTSWSHDNTANTLAAGNYDVQVRIVDLAGNVGATDTQAVLIDTTTPAANTIAITGIVDDSGVSLNDFITNDTALVFSGSVLNVLQPDERVQISLDGGLNWITASTQPGAGTSWSHDNTANTLAAGNYDVQVRIVDLAGNVGATDSQAVLIDTIAPTQTISIDSITENSGEVSDFITNDNNGLFINASLSAALASGETLQYSNDNGTSWNDVPPINIVDNGSGALTQITLFDGLLTSTSNIQFRVTDIANFSSVASQLVTIDNVAPFNSIRSISFNIDDGVPADAVTSVSTGLTVNALLNLTIDSFPDEVLQYSNDNGTTWNDVDAGNIIGRNVSFFDSQLTSSTVVKFRFSDGANYGLVTELPITIHGALGFSITGESAGDFSGFSVSDAGDVNGDGLADLIVGAYQNDAGASNAGRSYVVFGKPDSTAVNLAAIAAGNGGFVIQGTAIDDASGFSVSAAGDVNRDGFADLIVGAPGSDLAGTDTGSSYVVFGKANGSPVLLSDIALGTGNGFVITGQALSDRSGTAVAAAGDVNGDGFADLIVGAPFNDIPAHPDAGSSYVVFGKADTATVDLNTIASGLGNGFTISGENSFDESATSVASAGDVNGDGLADLIVGSWAFGPFFSGRSYVVFGKTDSVNVNLSDVALGNGGFTFTGFDQDESSQSVSSAGDVNGDGLADLIIDGRRNTNLGGEEAGRSYVVFGKQDGTPVSANDITLGIGGFAITGEDRTDWSGFSVSAAGDVNGDGLADLIVGALEVVSTSPSHSYVVFGKADGTEVNLDNVALGIGGFAIIGEPSNFTGISVSGAGDVNGDGLADLIVGANNNDAAAIDAGRSYVVFGKADGNAINLADVAAGGATLVAFDFNDTTGINNWVGTIASEIALGADGNDTLIGNGGADVLYGGLGDDVLTINTSNIQHLALGITDNHLARVDGGGGIDTLKVDGSNVTLNLVNIDNQAAGNIEVGSRVSSIEKIDINGSGNNTLIIHTSDVLDMSGMNLFNDGVAGWSGLGASVAKHQVVVDGAAGDSINIAGTWVADGIAANNGNNYQIYNAVGSEAQLLVDTDISRVFQS